MTKILKVTRGDYLPFWVPVHYVPPDWGHIIFSSKIGLQAGAADIIDPILMRRYGRNARRWKWMKRGWLEVVLHDPEITNVVVAAAMAGFELEEMPWKAKPLRASKYDSDLERVK
jgi:hypothetical protein